MKRIWVDAGNDPDYVALAKHDINAVFFDIRDKRLNTAYFDKQIARTLQVGVHSDWNWPETTNLGGAALADWTHQRLNVIAPNSANNRPRVCFDIEEHDSDYLIDCFERWRKLRPNRETSWTLESFQALPPKNGGWMTDEVIESVVTHRIRVSPQLYHGTMPDPDDRAALLEAQVAGDSSVLQLVKRGIPASLISPIYDAAALPYWWDGIAYTQGRLR